MKKKYYIRATLFIAAVAASATLANAAVTNQFEPYHGATHKVLDLTLGNNDPGAIYNSGNINPEIFGNLANQLWGLSANQSNYGSLEDMMGDWGLGVMPSGNVDNGWSSYLNADGSVDLSNIGGIPGLSYDQWSSTPGQNTMALTLRIPLSQLEADGVLGYNPQTDARILLGTNQIQNAFVGYDGGAGYGAFMNQYDVQHHVVPEPSAMLLLAAGSLALMRRRNPKH